MPAFVKSNVGSFATLNAGARGAVPIFTGGAQQLQQMVFTGSVANGDVTVLKFTGAYFNGGATYNFSYTASTSVPGPGGVLDTSIANLCTNISVAIAADATLLAAGFGFGNRGGGVFTVLYSINAQSGGSPAPTTFAYTNSGSTVVTFGTIPAALLPSGQITTFTYSALLKGFWYSGSSLISALNCGVPLETIAEICNRANVNLHYCIPLFYTAAATQSLATFWATNLNSNLSAILEYNNEIWNTATFDSGRAAILGAALGIAFSTGSVQQLNSFYGNRVAQLLPASVTGWTGAGRSRVSMICTMGVSLFGGSIPDWQNNRLNGALLVTSNAAYAAVGGLGATPGTQYNTFPNRPMDFCDALSYAPYYQGGVISNTIAGFAGAPNAATIAILTAGKNFALGSTASALSAVETDLRSGGGGGDLATITSQETSWETWIQTYTSQRAGAGMSRIGIYSYEGGYQGGLTNSVGGWTTDPTALATQFTNFGWNVSAYTVSGTNNATECAQQVVNLLVAFKNSSNFYSCVHDQLSGQKTIHTANVARTVIGSWYGYFNVPPGNAWSLYPGGLDTTPWQSYNALTDYNHGI